MNQVPLVSMVAMAGWLVLMIGAYRGHRVGMRQTAIMAMVWVGLFLLAAAIFTAIGMS